ncbi:MAG: hypothetical protein JW862_05860, partial [Anaerolineales bacterium]|nr:hypothetical protein [Anaerolineales bacterium]
MRNNPKITRILLMVFLIGLAIAAGIFTFNQVRALTATWNMTNLPGLALANPTTTPAPDQE